MKDKTKLRWGGNREAQCQADRAYDEARAKKNRSDRIKRLIGSGKNVHKRVKRWTKVLYRTYLETPWWSRRRLAALRAARFQCQWCGSRNHLMVHHLNYERLGAERAEDLEVVCRSCHREKHGLV